MALTGDVNWREELPGVAVLEREPMAAHTTFRIGGPAAVLLRPESVRGAQAALRLCRNRGLRPFFLGNGSNLLAPDGGYDGVVLDTGGLNGLAAPERDGIYAGSGVLLPRLAQFAAQQGLSGLEWAGGIPGSVGGAVRMNAGAYGGEVAQAVERVDYLDEAGKAGTLTGAGCGFAYRHSVFCGRPWLITGAFFRLTPGDPEEIRARMGELNRRRRERQPLEYPSAGSAFKRPPPLDGEPRYAAALIDACGLKGLRVGDAQVSEKHAGFIVNRGQATCGDVLALMDEVRRRVLAQTGVELEPEVEYLKV